MDKIFRRTKVTKFSDGDENFVQRKILSDIVLSDKVVFFHWIYFNCSAVVLLTRSSIDLIIFPSSFFAGFIFKSMNFRSASDYYQ